MSPRNPRSCRASPPSKDEKAKTPGHGRHAASCYEGARKVVVTHPELQHGDRCPECGSGNVYEQKEPKPLVRIVGQAPVSATVYELQRLRCNGCGQVFTAPEPDGVGTEKFDETAAAMIAQLKYGSGMPFARIEELERRLGIPLPASTQWEIVEEAAELAKPALNELIRQAASGGLFHNDDTGMRVLKMERPPGDERTGVFTSGIVSVGEGRRVALFFTGREHAGENLGAVLPFTRGGPARAVADVRCPVAQHAETRRRRGAIGGELSDAWPAPVCGGGGSLPRRMPVCVGNARPGVRQRR
jgi:transposase